MVTTSRRKSLNLVEQLQREPYRFEFFQAVRLLEAAATLVKTGGYSSAPVGLMSTPAKEAVRFIASANLCYANADVKKINTAEQQYAGVNGETLHQWTMEVSFIGLAGSQGVLPYHYTETIQKELRNKSEIFKDMLDVFNHRSISLYYQAWHKYQPFANFERSRRQHSQKHDAFTDAILSLIGLGTSELQYRLPIEDETCAGLGGHLARNICTADSLKGMLKSQFGLTVSIDQFKGQWQQLTDEVSCQLPDTGTQHGINNQLGVNSIIGSQCFNAQNKFGVILEPLDYADFMSLAPGSKKLEALKGFIKFCAGVELDFDVCVNTQRKHIPAAQLFEDRDYQPLLGWNTYLPDQQLNGTEILEVSLSQDMHSPDECLPTAY